MGAIPYAAGAAQTKDPIMFERILALFDASVPRTQLPPADAKFAIGALLVRSAMADRAYLFQEGEEIDRVLAKMYDLNAVEAAKMRAQCELLEHDLPQTSDLARILTDKISREKRERVVAALWGVVYADGNRAIQFNTLLAKPQAGRREYPEDYVIAGCARHKYP